MADIDSDDEDTFVTIGTPLEPYDEDDVVPKKATVFVEQTVKDKQGRQRFHGAFTGGFSAGYYNTVGSKEGFTPSTFVSSRNKKAEAQTARPEEFMDEEDLGQFGINPLVLATTSDFTSSKKRKGPVTSSGGIIPGDLEALSVLIQPAKLPIGVKLLRSLGWKEGQGVGPKVKRKIKVKKASNDKRVYGCALPGAASEDSSSADEYAQGLSFAPKDVTPINFTPRANTRGIGYSGIDPSSVFGPTQGLVELFEKPTITKTGRKGITGQAFGVGALEEDDDDVYGTSSMSNYDRVLGGEEDEDHLHGWTAPGARRNKPKPSRFSAPMSYVGLVLEGFKSVSASLKPKTIYRPPRVPRDYRPVHRFDLTELQRHAMMRPPEKNEMDAGKRSAMLGQIESVFDLVSKSDKDKMAAAKECPTLTPDLPRLSIPVDSPAPGISAYTPLKDLNETKHEKMERIKAAVSAATTAPGSGPGSTDFKPFAKEPQKQLRYEAYLHAKKQGNKAELDRLQVNMTEWDKEREGAEFERASMLYKPLSLLMGSRFQRAQYDDTQSDVKLPEAKKEENDQERAASLKMYGKLTREAYEWHPDRVLCKRFNIKNPYANSTIVGLPKMRRDKYSVFDFLTVREAPAPPPPPPEQDTSLAAVAEAKNKKVKGPGPLAILNKPSSPNHHQFVAPAPAADVQETETTAQATSAPMQNSADTSTQPAQPTLEKDPTQDPSRPPPDIFKAIFASSDSDSDSSDEDDAEETSKNDVKNTDVSCVRQPQQAGTTSRENPNEAQAALNLREAGNRSDIAQLPERLEMMRSTIQESQVVKPFVKHTVGKKGIFDMLNVQIQQEKETGSQRQDVNPKVETHNLTMPSSTPPANIELPPGTPPGPAAATKHFYGPLPPPPGENTQFKKRPISPSEDGGRKRRKHKHKDKSRSRSRTPSRDAWRKDAKKGEGSKDRSRSRNRKDNDRRRDRSRDSSSDRERKKANKKKDKKKKKKSKHKKQKHKSKKSKKTIVVSGDSEDADSESSSGRGDEDGPTSAEILQRLMMLKKRP